MTGNIWGHVPLLSVLSAGGSDLSETVVQLLIQLAVILFAAKVAGEMTARFLNLPTVLAGVGIGVVIGPFALGAIEIPGFGPLFPIPVIDGVPAVIPVSSELFAIAQIGSIVLLFAIGLETNLRHSCATPDPPARWPWAAWWRLSRWGPDPPCSLASRKGGSSLQKPYSWGP